MILIKLNRGQFIKNYCHVGSNRKTWISQNTSFTECFFSNFALVNLDLSFAYMRNGGFLLQRIYNKWGKILLIISPNSFHKSRLMNVATSRGWSAGLISNFRCVSASKRLKNTKYRFPNVILNVYQLTYFEDRIFSESSVYPIFYKSAKQLNEALLSSNYFFIANKSSFWSTRFYELLFTAMFKSFNIHIRRNFIVEFQKYKKFRFKLSLERQKNAK